MKRLMIACTAVVPLIAATAQAKPARPAPVSMERVDGIGGFFFKSESPKTLAQWYADHLGVSPVPHNYHEQPWRQTAGPTAFAPFPADTKMFGRPDRSFMLNFRVRHLDAMVAQLRRAGIAVEVDPQTYPNGRFASLADPEGNQIQLWQPQ